MKRSRKPKNWDTLTTRHGELVEKRLAHMITPAELDELEQVGAEMDVFIDKTMQPDIERLEQIRDELKAKGMWEGE